MIVTCPGCAANYRVQNEHVPETGAKMRCPKCQTTFLAMLPKNLRQPAPLPAEPAPVAAPPSPASAPPSAAPAGVLTSEQLPETKVHSVEAFASQMNDMFPSAPVAAAPGVPAREPSVPSPMNFDPASGKHTAATPPAFPAAATPPAFSAAATPPSFPAATPPAFPAPTPQAAAPPPAPVTAAPSAATPLTHAPAPSWTASALPSGEQAQPPQVAAPAPAQPIARPAATSPLTGGTPAEQYAAPPQTNSHMASTSMDQLLSAAGGGPAPAQPVPPTPVAKTANTGMFDREALDVDFDPFAELDVTPNPPPGLSGGGIAAPSDLAAPVATSSDFDIVDDRAVTDENSNSQPVARIELRKSGEAPAVRNLVEHFPTEPVNERKPSVIIRAFAGLLLVVGIVGTLGGGTYLAWAAGVLPLNDELLPRFEMWFDIRPAISSRGLDEPEIGMLVSRARTAEARGDNIGELVTHKRILRRSPDAPQSLARVKELNAALGLSENP